MKWLFGFLAAAHAIVAAPTVTITGPNGNVKAGTSVTLTATLSGSAGANLQAMQFSVAAIAGYAVTVADGAAATAAGKTTVCAAVSGSYNCITYGMNSNVIADGVLATFTFTVPKTANAGTQALSPAAMLGAMTDTNGNVAPVAEVAGSPFTLSTTSFCDVNSDGSVSAADLIIVIPQLLGSSICTSGDMNSDGKCDIRDLQIIANAAISGFCAAK